MAMRKKENFSICAPIAAFVPRQLALDFLHNHSEFITLNPMVTGHRPVKAPRDAPTDEYHSTWYEITERVQYIPGFGKIGSGDIKFNGCFHDMPWGLQTHIYAPMSVDMRAEYRIAGNQAGVEPRPAQAIGLSNIDAPPDGLYLRADIEFTSNIMLASFIRSQSKSALKEMVDRMVKKAESMDAGVLRGMIQDPRFVTNTPPQQPAPLFSPDLNQSVMQQNIVPEYTDWPPAVVRPEMNNTYFTEIPDISQNAFIAELPSMEERTHFAELPDTTQGPIFAEPATYKASFVAELPASELSSPTSTYSQHSFQSSISSHTQYNSKQKFEKHAHPVQQSPKRSDSPAQHGPPSSKHPNVHRKSTPKLKSSGHNLPGSLVPGHRKSGHEH